MTSKNRGMWLMLLAGILLAGAAIVATAGQKAPRAAAPPAPPAVAATPEPGEEFIFIEDGRAWLGVTLTDVTAEKARELRLAGEYGALVESVVEESPAAKAGIEKGDVITSFGGERVRSVAQLRRMVRETPAGRKLSVEVMRGGQSRTMEVALEARRMQFFEPEIAVAPRVLVTPRAELQPMPRFEVEVPPGPNMLTWSRGPRLGVTTDEISGQLAEYFGVKQGQGVLVKEVIEGSAAAKAGLKAGDVIVRLNDDPVNEVGDLRRALNQAESREVTVTIVRDRREQTLKVTLDEPQPQQLRPRRTAELDHMMLWEPQREEQEQALQAQLEALEMERMNSQEHQEQMRLREEHMREMEAQMEERLQSEQFEKQMQLLEKQQEQHLKQQLDSEVFQKQMRELEKRLREAERWRDVI
ncbi:MAG: PDZ domain-containing protein [Acidobacteria bacterium]|nr:PDZ domain-containing protein [Acidobacteriota bacterium]